MIARTIGRIAAGLIKQQQQAAVLGKTSRGLFLRLDSGWVVFLSLERCRGPLTINLAGSSSRLNDAGRAAPVYITSQGIFFPESGRTIDLQQAERWEAPARPEPAQTAPQRETRLGLLLELARARSPSSGFSELLQPISALAEQAGSQKPEWRLYFALRQAIAGGEATAIAQAALPFLGLGSGLTPSGDDMLVGMLLALNRWGDVLAPQVQVETLYNHIAHPAAKKTSSLSANLISCAALGQADERLLTALDGLATGKPDLQACSAALAGWGSSSGLDALVGMGLVVSANSK